MSDWKNASLVSKLFRKVYYDPLFWKAIASNLKIEISDEQNAKNVLRDHCKEAINQVFKYIGNKISRTSVIFEQYGLVEDYIRANAKNHKAELCEAARDENILAVKMFLKGGVPLHILVLQYAAEGGNKEIVRLLLDADAHKTPSAVSEAAREGHNDVLKMLIDAKVPIPENSESYFGDLIQKNNVEAIRILLDAGAKSTLLLVNFAQDIGTQEIVTLLQRALPPDEEIPDPEIQAED